MNEINLFSLCKMKYKYIKTILKNLFSDLNCYVENKFNKILLNLIV